MVLMSLGISHSYADEVDDFAPILELRSDLQCWPSYTNLGANSGVCRSRQEFQSDLPPVFWEDHIETNGGVTTRLISYWIYYSNQPKCSAIAGGNHVDDWEKITVHVEDGVLKHVTYNQHNGRYTLDSSSVPLKDGRPVAYVGKYSHGSYHDQRSQCTFHRTCFNASANYCFYWKDPRGPGVYWKPGLLPLSALSTTAVFPGSSNPHSRSTRPHQDKVCREDGGQDVVLGIGLENTCNRNPQYLKNQSMTLQQMATKSIATKTTLALKTYHNKYMAALSNGGGDVVAYAPAANSWETFEMAKVSGSECVKHNDVVYLRTGNGKYWRSNVGGALDAKASSKGWRTRYQITNHTNQNSCLSNNDVISLRNTAVNKYVVAENNGDANVNRTSIGNWEKFTVEIQ
jgi:hypothetical protein